jgi:hypothetical protein
LLSPRQIMVRIGDRAHDFPPSWSIEPSSSLRCSRDRHANLLT